MSKASQLSVVRIGTVLDPGRARALEISLTRYPNAERQTFTAVEVACAGAAAGELAVLIMELDPAAGWPSSQARQLADALPEGFPRVLIVDNEVDAQSIRRDQPAIVATTWAGVNLDDLVTIVVAEGLRWVLWGRDQRPRVRCENRGP